MTVFDIKPGGCERYLDALASSLAAERLGSSNLLILSGWPWSNFFLFGFFSSSFFSKTYFCIMQLHRGRHRGRLCFVNVFDCRERRSILLKRNPCGLDLVAVVNMLKEEEKTHFLPFFLSSDMIRFPSYEGKRQLFRCSELWEKLKNRVGDVIELARRVKRPNFSVLSL